MGLVDVAKHRGRPNTVARQREPPRRCGPDPHLDVGDDLSVVEELDDGCVVLKGQRGTIDVEPFRGTILPRYGRGQRADQDDGCGEACRRAREGGRIGVQRMGISYKQRGRRLHGLYVCAANITIGGAPGRRQGGSRQAPSLVARRRFALADALPAPSRELPEARDSGHVLSDLPRGRSRPGWRRRRSVNRRARSP